MRCLAATGQKRTDASRLSARCCLSKNPVPAPQQSARFPTHAAPACSCSTTAALPPRPKRQMRPTISMRMCNASFHSSTCSTPSSNLSETWCSTSAVTCRSALKSAWARPSSTTPRSSSIPIKSTGISSSPSRRAAVSIAPATESRRRWVCRAWPRPIPSFRL